MLKHLTKSHNNELGSEWNQKKTKEPWRTEIKDKNTLDELWLWSTPRYRNNTLSYFPKCLEKLRLEKFFSQNPSVFSLE